MLSCNIFINTNLFSFNKVGLLTTLYRILMSCIWFFSIRWNIDIRELSYLRCVIRCDRAQLGRINNQLLFIGIISIRKRPEITLVNCYIIESRYLYMRLLHSVVSLSSYNKLRDYYVSIVRIIWCLTTIRYKNNAFI